LPPLESWPSLPKVSVLVAAWNEADHIDRHIRSFLDLRYPYKELVLCAGGEDGTYHLATHYAGEQVNVLEQLPGEGKQRALRKAFPYASGEIIFLTDADCLLNSESFERLLYPLIIRDATVATGVSRPYANKQKNPFILHQWSPQRYNEIFLTSQYSKGLLGRNCALNRDAIEKAWESRQKVTTGTDYYLALRVLESGRKIRYIPESFVETRFPTSSNQYIRQQTRWLRNLLMWGSGFGDWYHVSHAIKTSMIGITLLLMPLSVLAHGKVGLLFWWISWGAVLGTRTRYVKIVTHSEEETFHLAPINLLKIMVNDFIAWGRVLFYICQVNLKERW